MRSWTSMHLARRWMEKRFAPFSLMCGRAEPGLRRKTILGAAREPQIEDAMRLLSSRKIARPNGALPAIWAAFAQQAAWKDWLIAALLILNATTILASARLAAREPDVVMVGPDGKST